MYWKDFLYFQRNSKTAVILLLILIVLTLILNILLSYRNSSDIVLQQNDSLVREFEEFKRSLTVGGPSSNGNVKEEYGSDTGQLSGKGSSDEGVYDQNDRSLSQQYMSRNIDKSSSRTIYPTTEKLSAGETISLNKGDTAEWKKIPGIGSAYASRIVKYRELLGGFVQAEQLLEVYGIDQELFSGIIVYIEPDGDIRRLQVNRSDFKELLRHPYLNYKQVQAIMGLRRKKGDISSIRELSILDEFTPEDIFRLEPYLEFK
ncbi:helix-hairpin-helix domain-containing protein [Proteiniphilum sp. UBA5384]|uniref:helix-hairpin-helix domain-containing protein n=1 Tax=Proteiniphilum sp. UBA5384 TaxID=1947279 RepID=UPI0025F4842D|nr:helix-hairpin-helix domain-containing protein [Proteiniphilum sp. UBA5384]